MPQQRQNSISRGVASEIALFLWHLLPGNPMVIRVVQGGSKRVRHLYARSAYLGLLLVVMMLMFLSAMSDAGSLADLAKGSSRVFGYISVLQLAMMCFLAPVFTAGAISQEKDAETFNVLLTTPLSNTQIALGSLAGRLFFVLALLLSGLPVFCITMIYGGVTADQVFASFAIAGSTALVTGTLAILISMIRVGTRGTIFSFYAGIALYLAVGYVLDATGLFVVPEAVTHTGQQPMSWLVLVHPFSALMAALHWVSVPEAGMVAHYGWPLRWMLASPTSGYLCVTLLASMFMLALATWAVRRGIKQGEVGLWMRIKHRFHRPEGDRRRRIRRVWANPVAWREAMTRASAASGNVVRYAYIGTGLAASVILYYLYWRGDFANRLPAARQWFSWIIVVEFVMVLMMLVNTAATAISRERESSTMDLLLTTPLTSRYIVWGKLRGLVSFAVPLMAVPALTTLMVATLEWFRGITEPLVSFQSAILLVPLLLVYAAVVAVIGLYLSLKNTQSVQAVLWGVGITVIAAFGLGICGLGLMQGGQEIAALGTPFSFVMAIWAVLNPQNMGQGRHAGTNFDYAYLWGGTVSAAAVYVAIVAAVYKSMVRNFDMIVRKQSK